MAFRSGFSHFEYRRRRNKRNFPACFLTELESHYLEGRSIANYFDLICGTSTGGIIALGLGSGMTASKISRLYIEEGQNIFPVTYKKLKDWIQYLYSPYKTHNLRSLLTKIFKEKKLKSSQVRLCIPSFEGNYSEVYVFKTPHHLDFKKDGEETMLKVRFPQQPLQLFLNLLEIAVIYLLMEEYGQIIPV